MKKLFVLLLMTLSVFFGASPSAYSAEGEPEYLELRNIDAGTFNEYRYLMGQKYLELKRGFNVNNKMEKVVIGEIAVLAKKGKRYLPNNLTNDSLYNNLLISLEKGVKQPSNANNFTAIAQSIQIYLEKTDIGSITGQVSVAPNEGNAPLPVSLRANVVDPSGSQLYDYNYTWWIDQGGKQKIIGNKPSIIYTFTKQGTFGVFLDVESNHKNPNGYTDVLPLRKKVSVRVNEKIASVILNVNNNKAINNSLVKISPEEAKYGVVFDATSSTPSDGSQFQRTIWNFGNGVKREYRGGPHVERVIYADKGEYSVILQLITNEGYTITRSFDIVISRPIAEIKASATAGFLGDKFNFSAKDSDKFEGLNYTWEIVDITREKVIYKRSGTSLSYIFPNKGKYNVKLGVGNGSKSDFDTKTIYINSRPPVADFALSTPDTHKPNRVLLDGTRSYDPDYSDEGRLQYAWFIDGEKAVLEDSNEPGSFGYYTFNSLGNHSVVLAVVDSDNISHQKQDKVNITSLLSVSFDIVPRVVQRDSNAMFIANSPRAASFEWDFGDGNRKSASSGTISHSYKQSGIYNVKLLVRDSDNEKTTYIRDIYVGDANAPYAFIEASLKNNSTISHTPNSCFGEAAYIANKVDPVQFSGEDSIDISGTSSGLEYTWKLGADKFFTQKNFSYQFDETGCFPVKLTVKSTKNGKSHSADTWIKVENLTPTLNSLNVQVLDQSTDPVIVNVSAQGAQDRDGVIQSYLWYYYTDGDSEPQDFKSTTTPATTFVLPKVTGNYYFVVVMKDSNEQRVNSEEATGEKFYITLTGDNLNTPLIDLSVSDSSIEIGESVVYTANVENILGQNISNEVEYSWDFDGDGFYEKQTKKPTISHVFTRSGEFHSKLKVKNKGFSNLKTTTINVANRLVADFDYISIGDKMIFINKSLGEVDRVEWDLDDGNKSSSQSTFTHVYDDNNKNHGVNLKIYEGAQVKEVTKTVTWNPKNILKSRKSDLNVFTYPETETGKLKLINLSDSVYVYLAESEDTYAYFAIDYDTSYDSDLNGGLDDDEDNKATNSYNTGAPAKIMLNDSRIQNVKILGKNSDNETLGVYELEITKLYVLEASEDDSGAIVDIEFAGVSDSERVKIEKLKGHLIKLPQQQRLKAMKYVEKLQEEWFDNTEKTRVIVEFEQYMDSTGYQNTAEVNELLESLLVEGQEDKSDKAITYNALKNLIPETITCEIPEGFDNCRGYLVATIEAIRDSEDVEQNKLAGSKLLEVVSSTDTMNDEQKLNFKEILKPFVYGGLENVPIDEGGIDQGALQDDESEGGGFFGFLKTIFKLLAIIFAILSGIILIFWIYYKLKNNDENIGFQDYIIDKTKTSEAKPLDQKTDVLGEVAEKKEEKFEEVLPTPEPVEQKQEAKQPKSEVKEVKPEVKEVKTDGSVPSWLAGASVASEVKQDEKVSEVKTEPKKKSAPKPKKLEEKVPEVKVKEEKTPEVKLDKVEKEINTSKELDDLTAIDDSTNEGGDSIPDWLKGSAETPTDKKEDKKTEPKQEPKKTERKQQTKPAAEKQEEVKIKAPKAEVPTEEIKAEVVEEVKIKEEKVPEVKEEVKVKEEKTPEPKKSNDEDLPDWLKGSMDEPKKDSKDKELALEPTPVDEPVVEEKITEPKLEDKTPATEPEVVAEVKPEVIPESVVSDEVETQEVDDKKEVKKDDLWDDGMDVPDWLKGTDDK